MQRMYQFTGRQTPLGILLGTINLAKSIIDLPLTKLLMSNIEPGSPR